jgi:hypothetical protein
VGRTLVLVIVLLALAGCGSSRDDVADRDRYAERWDARLEGYRAQVLLAQAETRRTAGMAARAMSDGALTDWRRNGPALVALANSSRRTFVLIGRERTLARFIERLQSEPSTSSVRDWLADEARDVRERSKEVDAMTLAFVRRLDEPVTLSDGFLRDLHALAAEQGMVIGRARELAGLYGSATALALDLDKKDATDLYASADDRDIAGWAMGESQTIDGALYQQRLDAALTRDRACRSADDGRVLCG